MYSIGERLEEARKRQGISIQEASENTKIRSDFLLQMEKNRFDIGLPEVYVEGFVRLYARYLKLDPEKIMTDYRAFHLGMGVAGKEELFGRMDLSDEPKASCVAREKNVKEAVAETESEVEEEEGSSSLRHPSFYAKVGLVFGGTLLIVVVAFLFIQRVFHSTPEVNPDLLPLPMAENKSVEAFPVEENIVIVASGDTNVRVREKQNRKNLFEGLLREGEQVSIKKIGPVEVIATECQNLSIEKVGGQKIVPDARGIGKFTVF